MDNERQGRLITIACQTTALLVVVAMLAGQYYAVLATNTPTLPVTGSEVTTSDKLGFFERIRLRRKVQDRYNQLSQLNGLTHAQQEQLEAIAELLGD